MVLTLVICTVVVEGQLRPPAPVPFSQAAFATWTLCWPALLFSYWRATDLRLGHAVRAGWTGAAVTAILTLLALFPQAKEQSILLLLSAAIFPSVLSWRWTLAAVSAQAAVLAGTQLRSAGLEAALTNMILSATVQLVMALLVRYSTDERHAKQELAQINTQLNLTRMVLETTSREAERMRIARDIHDTLGHHLTVLNLELEVLSLELQSLPHSTVNLNLSVGRAQQIQRRLIHDLRGTVDMLRNTTADLQRFTVDLQNTLPQIRFHFDLPRDVGRDLPHIDLLLMRLIQECTTNSVKHAAARTIWFLSTRHFPGSSSGTASTGRSGHTGVLTPG